MVQNNNKLNQVLIFCLNLSFNVYYTYNIKYCNVFHPSVLQMKHRITDKQELLYQKLFQSKIEFIVQKKMSNIVDACKEYEQLNNSQKKGIFSTIDKELNIDGPWAA